MTTVRIYAGRLTANREERTVSGLLVPYGEIGNSNLGRFTIDTESEIEIPDLADVPVLGNLDHDEAHDVGQLVSLNETDDGLFHTSRVFNTPAGDKLLDGDPNHSALSIELDDVVIEPATDERPARLAAGRVYGFAYVKAGAFPSARLAASAVEPTEQNPNPTEKETTTMKVKLADGSIVEAAPAEAAPQQLANLTPAPAAPNPSAAEPPRAGGRLLATAADYFEALAEAAASNAPARLLAALDEITAAASDAAEQPAWLGEIEHKVDRKPMYLDLVSQRGISGRKAEGWSFEKLDDDDNPDPAARLVAPYDGYPNEPHSIPVRTVHYSETVKRYAGANEFDRIEVDLPVPGFFEAYYREQMNDINLQRDDLIIDTILASALADGADADVLPDAQVIPDAVPAGVSKAASYLVDGVDSFLGSRLGMPEWALIGRGLYKDFLRTRNEDLLAYLNAAMGFEDGTLNGGNFKFKPCYDPRLDGAVLVGSTGAVNYHEPSGSPIRVEAAVITKGGVQKALFGYHFAKTRDARLLKLVKPAA